MSRFIESAYVAASATLGQTGLQIIAALLIFVVGWTLAGWAGRAVQGASRRSRKIDDTLAPLFAKVTRLFVIAITLVMTLEKIGVDTTSVIAVMGATGLAIGLALKDTISDLASGIVLLVLRPCSVGDAVDIGGEGGVVKAIDLFETKLETFEGVPVVMPNSKVRNSILKNFTRAARRRIDLTISVAYDADLARAIEVVTATVKADARVLDDPQVLVNVEALADSSVNLLVRVWTSAVDFFPTKLDLTKAIKLALDDAEIAIPYPHRQVLVRQLAT